MTWAKTSFPAYMTCIRSEGIERHGGIAGAESVQVENTLNLQLFH